MERNNLTQDWMDALLQHGFRQTRARRAIVEAILSTPHGMEPLEIYQRGQQIYKRLGLVTVYRTLETLAQLGLIERVHHPHGCNLFIRATRGHQHLLVCERCGQVSYFEGDDLSQLMEKVAMQSGYQISDHWLQLFGQCPDCGTKKKMETSSL